MSSTSLNVLVIDDDPQTARALAVLLGLHGYAADVCTASKDCLSAVEDTHPDVVLLDLNMPDLNGFDIAEELSIHRDLRPKLLVSISGTSPHEVAEKTLEAGFDAHLTKPIEWDDLERLLVTAR